LRSPPGRPPEGGRFTIDPSGSLDFPVVPKSAVDAYRAHQGDFALFASVASVAFGGALTVAITLMAGALHPIGLYIALVVTIVLTVAFAAFAVRTYLRSENARQDIDRQAFNFRVGWESATRPPSSGVRAVEDPVQDPKTRSRSSEGRRTWDERARGDRNRSEPRRCPGEHLGSTPLLPCGSRSEACGAVYQGFWRSRRSARRPKLSCKQQVVGSNPTAGSRNRRSRGMSAHSSAL
jgi:hypothetical protein